MVSPSLPLGQSGNGIYAKHKPAVKEVHIVWITAGLGCDGDSVSVTGASEPSIEDLVMGAFPGLPKVYLHNPVLAYEILTLRILTLTDEEKATASGIDDRTRRLIERTESLAREQLAGLHGTVRSLEPAANGCNAGWHVPELSKGVEAVNPHPSPETQGRVTLSAVSGWDPLAPQPPIESILVDDVPLRRGDRVRLRPGLGGDTFDLALAGKTATIESIEQDFEDQFHVAVTLDDDPGQDLGRARQPGHRFFFKPEEIAPLAFRETVT